MLIEDRLIVGFDFGMSLRLLRTSLVPRVAESQVVRHRARYLI